MNKLRKTIKTILLMVFAFGVAFFINKVDACAKETLLGAYDMTALVESDGAILQIGLVNVEGQEYLFLPGFASINKLSFQFDSKGDELTIINGTKQIILESGKPVNTSSYLGKEETNGSRLLTINATNANGEEKAFDLYIMKSSAISSIFLTSGDKTKGRDYVEAKKTNTTNGSMVMLSNKGKLVYSGNLKQIKGRGNTTFNAIKKPYQIKLEESADLTLTGLDSNKSKTWILLANAYDPTLIHNTVGYRLAKKMKLNVPDCIPVDLYYDGNYRGNYLLTEKVEIGDGRVNIASLEKQNKKANDDNDCGDNATEIGTNKYGATISYVKGVKNPEDITGGYLIEQDNAYYMDERSYFVTTDGVPFVIKSPENCSKEEVLYISEYVEEMMQAAKNGGINPSTGKSVWDYVDKTTLARYFIFNQIVCNADAFVSSTYFYLDQNEGLLMAGPVWDLDDSYGIREDVAFTEGFCGDLRYMTYFIELPEFRNEVKKYYSSYGYSLASNQGINSAAKEISASEKMNRILWNGKDEVYQTLENYNEDINYMNMYAGNRAKWLKQEFLSW